MKVYVVYGYSFSESFCIGAYSNLEKALFAIYTDFSEYLTECVEMDSISLETYNKELTRVSQYVKEGHKTDMVFLYTPPCENDQDYIICYDIAETEIQ